MRRKKIRTPAFQARLKTAMSAGNLTLSDMARWFDRKVPTMRGWVQKGTQPGGGPIDKDHAFELLALLETLIRKKKLFPVPRLTPKKRIEYLGDIRKALFP